MQLGLTFIELSRNSKKDAQDLHGYKLALLGDCTTQYLSIAIRGYAYTVGRRLEVFEADYNQIDSQTMNKNSDLYAFEPNTVLLFMCSEKLYESFCKMPVADREKFADVTIAKICAYWDSINSRIKTNIVQITFAYNDDCVFGNYALKTSLSFAFQLQKLNYLLAKSCQKVSNTYLVDLNNILSLMGRRIFFDSKIYYMGKSPVSLNVIPILAKSIIDIVNALEGTIKKCVILDLDNTIWGGVIGDDGLDGIEIGDLGIGHVFTDFQLWLRELKNRGIILAVCSKNNEETAKEAFIKHPEMVLKLDDISVFVANWEDKASNINYIQKTLNIGMDSIVFIDDNKFEREAVKTLIPEITVPDLPEDPVLYLSYLKGLNLFETTSYSEEDRERTSQYIAEANRSMLSQKLTSYGEYLQGLDMIATVAPFDKFHYPRIAQLTQRSNQFNLRTVRHTEATVEQIANDNRYVALYFCLKDKFGDHGLVSVVVLDKPILHADQAADALFISEWLMSCRVLNRGMEEFITNKIVEMAILSRYNRVIGEYIPSHKNAIVSELYDKMGFMTANKNKNGCKTYVLNVSEYKNKQCAIKEE